MMNNKFKYTVLIVFTLLVAVSSAQTMSELVHTDLQEIDVASSTITLNGQRYKYQPNKKESMFRGSKIEPKSLRSLIKGHEYHFEIQQNFTRMSANANKQATIIFISEEKLPE